jgi:DNA-binding Lrp family transcriptional regulator
MAFCARPEDPLELDEIDRKILSLLQGDSRTPYAEIGKKVHLSAPAVHARVKKLETNGVIEGYSVRVKPEAVGANLCAFVRIARSKGKSSDVANELIKLKQVEEVHSVAGEDCLIVKLRVGSSLELSHLLDRIRQNPNYVVDRTITAVVLETHFERGVQA